MSRNWAFAMFAALLGFFVSLAASSTYDLLNAHIGPLTMLVISVFFSVFIVDYIFYMISTLNQETDPTWGDYIKSKWKNKK